jgi:hypothetical protein
MTKPKRRGRPPLTGETMRRVLVVLDTETIERARKMGHGNVSAGLRALATYKTKAL